MRRRRKSGQRRKDREKQREYKIFESLMSLCVVNLFGRF